MAALRQIFSLKSLSTDHLQNTCIENDCCTDLQETGFPIVSRLWSGRPTEGAGGVLESKNGQAGHDTDPGALLVSVMNGI
jgi:hypothetical protein